MQKTFYIIYEVVRDEEGQTIDILNKFDSDYASIICEWLGIATNHIGRYIAKDIEAINCKLRDDKYFIFKEKEED